MSVYYQFNTIPFIYRKTIQNETHLKTLDQRKTCLSTESQTQQLMLREPDLFSSICLTNWESQFDISEMFVHRGSSNNTYFY